MLPDAAFFPFYWLQAAAFLTAQWTARTARQLASAYVIHLWGRGAWAVGEGSRFAPPSRPDEPCSPAYRATVYGHLSCQYAGKAA